MRHFIRHPVNIPIEAIPIKNTSALSNGNAHSLGIGGLAFSSDLRLKPGTIVQIKIRHALVEFVTEARVVWCQVQYQSTDLGVEFLDREDAFTARMVEQICHIENYRQSISHAEGRNLTEQQAAEEWVSKFAANFPNYALEEELRYKAA